MSAGPGDSGRLFIGIPLDDAMRKALGVYARQIEPRAPGRYVAPKNYHVTLAFLGDTPFASVPHIRTCLEQTAIRTSAFDTSFAGTGHFGKDTSATLWAGLAGAQRIDEMARDLRSRLDAIETPYDRKPCRPHITIARKVDMTRASLPPLAAARGRLDRVVLFHSRRERGALVYAPLATFPLA